MILMMMMIISAFLKKRKKGVSTHYEVLTVSGTLLTFEKRGTGTGYL